jgi:tetratricopeptide (TPR) repeat protein
MDFDVFISYPHQDKSTADAACAMLEAARIKCWIAPRDIAPGAEWAASIIDAIDRCRAMILVFSSRTNSSKQIQREVQRAFEREVPVVPFRIEEVAPEKSLAYYMGPVHWLDALTPPLEAHIERLVDTLKSLLESSVEKSAEGDERLSEAQALKGQLDSLHVELGDAQLKGEDELMGYIANVRIPQAQWRLKVISDDFISDAIHLAIPDWKPDDGRELQYYNKAIQIAPSNAHAFYRRGDWYARKGDHDRAIQDYDEAIRLDPNYVPALTGRGRSYDKRGQLYDSKFDWDRAVRDFSEAIRIDPENEGKELGSRGDLWRALHSRGDWYARNGDYDRAIRDYDQAVHFSNGDARAFFWRGMVHAAKKDYGRAIQDYNDGIFRGDWLRKEGMRDFFAEMLFFRGQAKKHVGDAIGAKNDLTAAEEVDSAVAIKAVKRYPHLLLPL